MKFIQKLIIFLFIILGLSSNSVFAIEFEVAVIPADIFSVCDNYYCFPEVSDIVANDVVMYLNKYKRIKARQLSRTRHDISSNPVLKQKTVQMLSQYSTNDKVDFSLVKDISNLLGVKSIVVISSYTTTDKASIRRGLWTTMEITNAFRTTYPFTLNTNAILTDSVNGVIMWSGKYKKAICDSEGKFITQNQTQAFSNLEKFKLYSKDNVAKSISQNIYMRFFPPEVRTVDINTKSSEKTNYVPNALEHLSDPKLYNYTPPQNGELDYTYFDDTFLF